jgi:hypothetical protein
MPNLSLSAITYPSIRPLRSGHVITQSRKISANSPSAERKRIADRGLLCRIFLKKPSFFPTDFFTELGAQIRLLSVPNFGVNNWPTAVADASEIVRTCEGCQFYTRKTNLPAHALQTIPVTWPFAVWGLDIVGPVWKAPGGYTHLLVAIDKFSKWVEMRPITNLRAEQVVTFFTDIIYRFGVPNSIITDNGSQFTGRKFLEFCDKLHIRVD